MARGALSLLLLTAVLTALWAQEPKTAAKSAGTGSLKGRVFSITKTGDVKPALLANVYLFVDENPANKTRILEVRAQNEYEAKIRAVRDDPTFTDHLIDEGCHDVLNLIDRGIAADKDSSSKLISPAVATETDETGNFEVSRISPGDYQIVARGQAGSSDALWIDKVTISPEEAKTLKLGSAALACRIK